MTGGHQQPRLRAIGALIVSLTAVVTAACAEGKAQFEVHQRDGRAAAWLEQQHGLQVCRVEKGDLGYSDSITIKAPMRDESDGEHLDCSSLLKSRLKVGVPMSLSRLTQNFDIPWEGRLADYNVAQTYPIVFNTEPRFPHAVAWMQDHRDVKACVFSEPETAPVKKPPVLIRDCEGHLIFITHGDAPPETPTCGQADIPACSAAKP